MQIQKFVFNSFMVNTYIVFDETKDCMIIDPACYSENERITLKSFIKKNNLNPIRVLFTHGHVDHLLGGDYIKNEFSIESAMNEADFFLIENAVEFGSLFGFSLNKPSMPEKSLFEGDLVKFGNTILEIYHVPGHSPGSIVFYEQRTKSLISGDVLFNSSIGRTDLPLGNHEELISGIKSKLLTLPDNVIVYPGHNDNTSIGFEKKNNPFLI
jgi:glyoxylase-like metal-dependent hydrolase (beta-lactamase superfamily II)